MPRTRSLSWVELRIGVVTLVAIVITAAAIFMLTGDRGFFWQRYNLKTRFANVAGLRAGSPVRVAGFDVGTVERIEFVGEEVDVTIQVNVSMRERITTESTAYLGSVSLLGESAVDINPSTSGTPIPTIRVRAWLRSPGASLRRMSRKPIASAAARHATVKV